MGDVAGADVKQMRILRNGQAPMVSSTAYGHDVIPGTLRHVRCDFNHVSDIGVELIIARPRTGCARCLSAYVCGQSAGTVIVENAVNYDNAAWQATTILEAT